MTPNKRNKKKTRALMAATGTNYVRAARSTGSAALKDPARLSWSPGTIAGAEKPVKVIDSPVTTSFPHLLITGISAAEPEAMLVDMMDQLIAANTPEDIQFRIIEPTIPLSGYKNSPHVAQYMDSWTPNEHFMPNALSMMDEAVTEMNRRNALMINHPQSVYNLGKAREVAIRESNQAGTPLEDHPLWLPYIFIVVHEAAALFEDSTSKDERGDQQSIFFATAELARKSRSAGIYLVMSAKVLVAVPPVIRDQMRMIALSAPSEHYSTIIVGDDSLVGLPQNKGVVVGKGSDENTVFDRNPIT